MEKIDHCPHCQSNQIQFFITCKDYVGGIGESFNLESCQECGLIFTNPRPTELECGIYYQSSNYVSHSDQKKDLAYRLYRFVRSFNLANKYKIISPYIKNQEDFIIDYGCGLGTFLNYIHQKHQNVKGFDISEEARNVVKERYNITALSPQEISTIPSNSAAAITTWHVLEHIYNLHELLDEFYRIIKPGGVLVVALPNPKSYDALKMKEYWDGYDVPRHIYHFPPDTIKNWVTSKGFKHTKTEPLIFDSYYISLRSYFHKKSFLPYIKGFFTGLISNIKGASKRNFSSNIYIFTK